VRLSGDRVAVGAIVVLRRWNAAALADDVTIGWVGNARLEFPT